MLPSLTDLDFLPNQIRCLQINALDFSDLWDEEDLYLDTADDDNKKSPTNQTPGHKLEPPTPPPAPPLALSHFLASPVPPESTRQTLRLHWKELLSLQPLPRVSRFGSQSIWASLEPVHLDTNRLEYLFESKSSNNKVLSVLTSGKRVRENSIFSYG